MPEAHFDNRSCEAAPLGEDAWSPAPLQALHLIDEITHRVVNEYTEAICALGLAAAGARSSEVRDALDSVAGTLRAQVEAHRALQAPVEDGPLDLATYAGRVCARLAAGSLTASGVRLSLRADGIWLDADRCWRVGLILAELIRNGARHGLAGGAGHIRVDIAESDDWVRCVVRDDGHGRPGIAGRGHRVVQALAAELSGSVDWAFGPGGCCARLSFASSPGSPVRQRLPGCAAPILSDLANL